MRRTRVLRNQGCWEQHFQTAGADAAAAAAAAAAAFTASTFAIVARTSSS
jgi:hypothetical protein